MKRVVVSVINDLATDQRVARMCDVLHYDLNFEVLLIGRKLKNSLPLSKPYPTKRFKLIFTKGALFYAEYNFRLFWYLLFRKCDILVSNDLDTLLPNFLVSKIRRKEIVYDSHEYFTGVPELENRKFVRSVWTRIEKFIFPKLKYIFTVNDSIAQLYEKEYNKKLIVVKNIPKSINRKAGVASRNTLNLPIHKKVLILQGAGINVERGAEEAVLAMQFIENAVLYIVGDGDVIDTLKQMVKEKALHEKVFFKPKMPYNQLMEYTMNADVGLTLDKATNINYRFSLPNKLFDYIHAGIPVFASALIEIEKIITKYEIGLIASSHNPIDIAIEINKMLVSTDYNKWKQNTKKAAKELCWEVEKRKVINVYEKFK